MKVAVSMWSLHKLYRKGEMDVFGFIDYAAELGVDGVELLDFFWKDISSEPKKALDRVKSRGLKVAAYAIGNNFVNPDVNKRMAEVEKIRNGVDMAVDLETKIVRVFSGDLVPGIKFEDAKNWILEGLSEGAKYAERKGVVLALENHGLLAGKSSQVKEIIETVGSPSLRSTIDTGNFLLVNEKPVDAVRTLGSLAAHVHFKDMKKIDDGDVTEFYTALDGTRYIGTVAGEGDVQIDEVVKLLKEAGYNGYLSVEFEGLGDPKEGTRKSVEYLQRF
ncbi:MAG TPA: sugar phosphate isomerase/epimerase [Firmicutes bacterium]|nr:sugar phosphate isomerase/epimerase [Bacillota bacterium]